MSAILVNTITNRDGSNGPVITGITTIGIITSNASIGSTDIFVEQIVFGQTGILTAAVSMGTTDLYVSGNTYGNLVGNVTGDVTGIADTATDATNITLADESSDTSCFPIFAVSATGNQPPKTNTSLTFNSSTGNLGATIFTASDAVQLAVYADTTARDAAITIPAAGMIVFVTDGDGLGAAQFQGYDGSAWVALN
jgi:hypothetical protein